MKYIVAYTTCLLLKPRPRRRVLKKYNRKFRTVSHCLSLSRNNNTSHGTITHTIPWQIAETSQFCNWFCEAVSSCEVNPLLASSRVRHWRIHLHGMYKPNLTFSGKFMHHIWFCMIYQNNPFMQTKLSKNCAEFFIVVVVVVVIIIIIIIIIYFGISKCKLTELSPITSQTL
jgi:hypothetical protein